MTADKTGQNDRAADDASHLVELGRLQGQVKALEERVAALDAAEEHHRVELDAARTEAADARAALREAQARVEDWRQRLKEMKTTLDTAEELRRRAEDERSAVIAALGRRARRQLDQPQPTPR